MQDDTDNLPAVNSVCESEVSEYFINFTHSGNGAPIILTHGLAASLHDWDNLIPELNSADYSTYALDLPGHGGSAKLDHLEDYNIGCVLSKFSTWIESLQIQDPLILIGHSLGGYLSLQYTIIHPNRVCALVLCDPFYSLSQLPYLLQINYRHSLINPNILNHLPEWFIRRIIDFTSLSIRNGYQLPKAVREQTAADYKRIQPEIFNIISTLRDISPNLHLITQPTLVLWGAHDHTLSKNSFFRILLEIQNSKGVAIPTAGHVPHQSHPAEFNRLVLEFLNSLSHK